MNNEIEVAQWGGPDYNIYGLTVADLRSLYSILSRHDLPFYSKDFANQVIRFAELHTKIREILKNE